MYLIILIFIGSLLIFSFAGIKKYLGTKERLELTSFQVSLNNKLSNIAGTENIEKLSLAIPTDIDLVCFTDKNKGYDEFISPELNNQVNIYDTENIFIKPFDKYAPINLNFQLEKSPLCVNAINGKINLQLKGTGSSAVISAAGSEMQKECTNIFYNGDYKDKIDIVFLPNQYDNINNFADDVENYINNVFISTEPFNSKRTMFNFYRIDDFEDIGCEITSYIICNSYKTKSKASNCPADFIVVLTDRSKIIDMAVPIRSAAFSNMVFINTADKELVLLHELGHTLGKLADEYVDDQYYADFDIASYPNCDTVPCAKWEIVTNKCVKGCSLSSYYRGSEDSIMRNYFAADYFGEVNENIINKNLEAYK